MAEKKVKEDAPEYVALGARLAKLYKSGPEGRVQACGHHLCTWFMAQAHNFGCTFPEWNEYKYRHDQARYNDAKKNGPPVRSGGFAALPLDTPEAKAKVIAQAEKLEKQRKRLLQRLADAK